MESESSKGETDMMDMKGKMDGADMKMGYGAGTCDGDCATAIGDTRQFTHCAEHAAAFVNHGSWNGYRSKQSSGPGPFTNGGPPEMRHFPMKPIST